MTYKSRLKVKQRESQPVGKAVHFLLIFALFIVANTLLISPANAEADISDRIRFYSLTIEDGLSQSTVYDITEDRFGFMWFGTQDGLNRYDGVKFDQLRHVASDPKSLVSPTINQLLYDNKDTVWVLTPQGLDGVDTQSLAITHWTEDIKNLSSDDELQAA